MQKHWWDLYDDPVIVNWEGRGYFAYPDVIDMQRDGNRPSRPKAALYPQWIETLRRAKLGDFSHIPALVAMVSSDTDPISLSLCKALLGDAGATTTIDAIALKLANGEPNTASGEPDFEVTLVWSSILSRRGKLADMPHILAAYARFAEIRDADILPCYLCDCLETSALLSAPEDFDSLDSYRAAVTARCAELSDRFGTDQVLLHEGEPLSVTGLAERILRRLREPYFPYDLRRRFECATGIDCSSFYENGFFKPMQAAALIQDFLESPQSRQFEDGVRYFFGHRIPD